MDDKWIYSAHVLRALRLKDFSLVGFEELAWAHAALIATAEDPDRREAAVSSNVLSTIPASICRMIGADNGFEWIILAEPDEVEEFRAHGIPILDESISPLLGKGDSAPKIDASNIALLTDEQKCYLAHGFGMMSIAKECDARLLFFNTGKVDTVRVSKLVASWTLGRDNVNGNELPDSGWQAAYVSHNNRVDENALVGIPEYDSLVEVARRVEGCRGIWDSVLKRHHIKDGIGGIDFKNANEDEIHELAEMFGIAAYVEALYAGVPVEDILA